MVVDIHSHILPGIDDGAKDMEETMEMLQMAVDEGIEAIISTPHYDVRVDEERMARYQEAYEQVKGHIAEQALPIQLFQGNEIYYSESVLEALKEGRIKTLNGSRHILVEFPMYAGSQTIERALCNFLYAGYWPILAHAERYSSLRDIEKIKELVRVGVRVQVNVSAVSGKEGWLTKRFCMKLLQRELVHFVATDAHGSEHRRPLAQECIDVLDKKVGKKYRRKLMEDNPLKVLQGEKIQES